MNIQKLLLTKNIFSRPGKALTEVRGIVLHWVANPGTSALANRNYFENLSKQSTGDSAARYASAHFIIGIDGEIIQCVPTSEMAYHVGAKIYKPDAISALGHYPNNCTLGIELCHPDATGAFTKATLGAAVELCKTLAAQFNLYQCNFWTHYEITGKLCPKWFVEHPDDFHFFKTQVAEPF
jgi:N-acetylmuramoyl-L-alanine amidase